MSTAATPAAEKRDVARFLEAHESCGSDFDIRRAAEVGEGGLRLVCNGCGKRAAYELGLEGTLTALEPPADETADPSVVRRRVTREQLERWLPAPPALPWWVPNAYILAVIAVGLGMIAFGVISRDGEDPARFGGAEPGLEEPGLTAPPGTAAPAPAAVAPVPGPSPDPAPARPAQPPELDRITALGRFTIGVPQGWTPAVSGGAVVLRPQDGDADLLIFLEPGRDGAGTLARRARRFLSDRHPGAGIVGPRPIRLGGDRAMWLQARLGGGYERAVTVSKSGYEYLLLVRVHEAASLRLEAQASAALKSFRGL